MLGIYDPKSQSQCFLGRLFGVGFWGMGGMLEEEEGARAGIYYLLHFSCCSKSSNGHQHHMANSQQSNSNSKSMSKSKSI